MLQNLESGKSENGAELKIPEGGLIPIDELQESEETQIEEGKRKETFNK